MKLGQHVWGSYVGGVNADQTNVILVDSYAEGNHTLCQWRAGYTSRKLLYGVPLEERREQQEVPLNSIKHIFFTPGDGGCCSLPRSSSTPMGWAIWTWPIRRDPQKVSISGVQHSGMGELVKLKHLREAHYALEYNIDGCSWLYEGTFDRPP